MSAGIKESEIGYQLAYSKQELRKVNKLVFCLIKNSINICFQVIAAYPAKEVKKGLESLYKKVERHLCDEENLVQVSYHLVFRGLQ